MGKHYVDFLLPGGDMRCVIMNSKTMDGCLLVNQILLLSSRCLSVARRPDFLGSEATAHSSDVRDAFSSSPLLSCFFSPHLAVKCLPRDTVALIQSPAVVPVMLPAALTRGGGGEAQVHRLSCCFSWVFLAQGGADAVQEANISVVIPVIFKLQKMR